MWHLPLVWDFFALLSSLKQIPKGVSFCLVPMSMAGRLSDSAFPCWFISMPVTGARSACVFCDWFTDMLRGSQGYYKALLCCILPYIFENQKLVGDGYIAIL